MTDILWAAAAGAGLWGIGKAWNKWGKDAAASLPFATKGMKAGKIDRAKEKKDKETEIAKKIADDPKSSAKDKKQANKDLAKLLTPTEKAQRKLDAVKAKDDEATTKADAAAIGYKKDEDGIIISPGDAEKYKKKAKKAPSGWETGEDGKLIRKDEKPKEPETKPETKLVPKGNKMTITESNELQAIMALDDAGIKAEINRKGEVVVKKKDLKKAQKELKKSFKKGGQPDLVGEEVEVDEAKEFWAVIDKAKGGEVMAISSDEKGAKSSVKMSNFSKHDYHFGKDPRTLKIVKVAGSYKKGEKMIGTKLSFKEEVEITEALKPLDKSVIDAFYYKKEKAGKVVSTDGDSLEKNGIGGNTIAQWLNPSGKIAIATQVDSKSTESILKYMKKSIPKGNFDKQSYKKFFGEELQRTAYELVSEARKKAVANKPQWEKE